MTEPGADRAAPLLTRLVGCASVNPAGGEGAGEAELAALLAGLLAGWGAVVATPEVLPGRPNVVARFAGRDRSRTLLLEAHTDTVPAGAMTVDPFAAGVRDGRLHGRGACDDKGPMAAMLLGLETVLAGGAPPVDVVFAGTCDEEVGAAGAKALMASDFRPTAAVVAEPTELAILLAHKGAVRWRLTARGRSAHSATPAQGVNAITAMARVLAGLERELGPRLAARPHPRLGAPTWSAGRIAGGTQVNVVPDRCTADLDRRLVPGETPEAATAELEEVLAGLRRADPALDLAVERTAWYPAFEESKSAAVARLAERACREALGRAEFAGAPWTSNASQYRGAGVPTILFGPGSIAQAHAPDEWIEVADVAAAARVYAGIIRGAGGL